MKSKIFVSGLLIQFLLIACQKKQPPIALDIDCAIVTCDAAIHPSINKHKNIYN